MRYAVAMALIMLLKQEQLFGQDSLRSGQTVRITSARYELKGAIGRVLAATPDTIVLESQGARTVNYRLVSRADTLTLPITAIDRLDLRHDGGHHTGRGALIGLGIGAAAGLVIGIAAYEPCPPNGFCIMQPTSAVASGMMGALAFGVLGSGVGAIIGSLTPAGTWDQMPLRASASLRPLPQAGVGLSLSVPF
jgi:hypothetical protein